MEKTNSTRYRLLMIVGLIILVLGIGIGIIQGFTIKQVTVDHNANPGGVSVATNREDFNLLPISLSAIGAVIIAYALLRQKDKG